MITDAGRFATVILRILNFLDWDRSGGHARRMKKPREYTAKCPKCKMVYVSEDLWKVCPVCGKPLILLTETH